ncbi:MAG: gamma carbonic anhydrase family protein [Fusobacteria bacterium]|nr:gamma carbonic anhydrase family protein [Fusobacteriota bacterium]
MIYELHGCVPEIDASCYVSPNASIIGKVKLAKNVSIWDFVAIRGDLSEVSIGENSNVQENTSVHLDKNFPVKIGKNVTIGHRCVIHGCEIGDNVVIGMGSILLNGSKIPSDTIIGAGSLVTASTQIESGTVFAGSPAKFLKKIDEKLASYIKKNSEEYQELAHAMKSAKRVKE